MDSPVFKLLQNEGFLLQGCLCSGFQELKNCEGIKKNQLYAAFFSYFSGLERLLKVIAALAYAREHGKFPDFQVLKSFGHDIVKLYEHAESLRSHSLTRTEPIKENNDDAPLDDIDNAILTFLSNFATTGRYFNLDRLTGGKKSSDPLLALEQIAAAIYERDVKKEDRAKNETEIAAGAKTLNAFEFTTLGFTGLDGHQHTTEEALVINSSFEEVRPYLIWRLAGLVKRFWNFLGILSYGNHENLSEDIPIMHEFIGFTYCEWKFVVDDEDWPSNAVS